MGEAVRIEELLDGLCNLCDDELERQETSLALCRAQGEGLRARNLAYIDAKTAALDTLIREAADAEKKRLELVRTAMERWGLRDVPPTLTTLIQAAPEPSRTRLIEFQSKLRRVLAETRRVVSSNATLLRVAMSAVDDALRVFEMTMNAGPQGYTQQGNTPRAAGPALIDRRG